VTRVPPSSELSTVCGRTRGARPAPRPSPGRSIFALMSLYRSGRRALFGRETLGVEIDRLAYAAFIAELWANA
jgi:hypothetical protein